MQTSRSSEQVTVVVFERAVNVDDVLAGVVAALRRQPVKVGGLLQHFGERLGEGCRSMWLEDIATGERRRIDLPRGPGASGCSLNPDALASAAAGLRDTIREGCDVIVVNRFGGAEANGSGMRAEIAEAVLSGAHVLIAVRDTMVEAMAEFLGRAVDPTPPDVAAILHRVQAALSVPA